jgi:hypothetical protein
MSVIKIIEVKSSSPKSFEDAIKTGLDKTGKTVKNLKSAWIKEQEVDLKKDGTINEYRVLMKVSFLVE